MCNHLTLYTFNIDLFTLYFHNIMEDQSQTLYIKNLNDKVNKLETKRLLYHLFCTYGCILEIQTSKTGVLRGQAFIVFQSGENAAIAKRDLDGFVFLSKPLKIFYARAESHAIQKLQGTFQYQRKPRKLNAPISLSQPLANEDKKQLRVTGLHPSLTRDDIEKLFSQYFGLEEIVSEENACLVKYSTHRSAALALAGLQGFKISKDYELKISFDSE